MRVAVVDIGSNTIRLLIAEAGDGWPLTTVREGRAYVGLGAEIVSLGEVSERKLLETADVVRRFTRTAAGNGAERIEVIVTAPGRQAANGDALVDVVGQAARLPARLLSAEEESLLAYQGALSRAPHPLPESVAVCDLGGGSTELAIGAPPSSPAWFASVDVGALRLTAGFLAGDPPTKAELAAAADEVRQRFDGIAAPRPRAAFVVGGSARGLSRLVGATLGRAELAEALSLASGRRASRLAQAHRLDIERARVLPAAALILTEVDRRLAVPLQLVRGGVREGAASALLRKAEEAA